MKSVSAKILSLLLSLFVLQVYAQNSSSYSRYAIGDIEYSHSVRRMGMGQLGIAISDVDFISVLNPASLYKIGKTRIEFNMNYNGIFLSDNAQKKYFAETEFSGFTFGFPISSDNGIGFAIGLVPFTNVSYKAVQNFVSTNPLISDYKIEYSGVGGLSKAFLSSSYLLPFDAAIGASVDYYFGDIDYKSRVDFPNSSSLSSLYIRNQSYRGIGGTFGVISPDIAKILELKSVSDFRLGFSTNIFSTIKDDTLYTAESFLNIDTLSSGRGEVNIPNKIILGLSFVLHNEYTFCLDYAVQDWSAFKSNGNSSSFLRNYNKISAGFEYRPQRVLGSSFGEQIILRAGLSLEQTQYKLNNTGINQYSVSLGASLPISNETYFDLALVYSRKGTKENNLLQEDIIKLGIGLSLGELWFIRQEK